MSGLLELADRCEAATGPDRRLDYEIMTVTVSTGHGYLWDPKDSCHRYTESLDAAITRVPEGCQWSFDSHYAIAEVHEYWTPLNGEDYGHARYIGEAATPALALCAAALKARATPTAKLNAQDEGGEVVTTAAKARALVERLRFSEKNLRAAIFGPADICRAHLAGGEYITVREAADMIEAMICANDAREQERWMRDAYVSGFEQAQHNASLSPDEFFHAWQGAGCPAPDRELDASVTRMDIEKRNAGPECITVRRDGSYDHHGERDAEYAFLSEPDDVLVTVRLSDMKALTFRPAQERTKLYDRLFRKGGSA